MKNKLWINILLSFGLVILVAGLGTLFVNLGFDWFAVLNKPQEWVPDFVIPIAWTIIYTISAFVIYDLISKNLISKSLTSLFAINGALNVLWCLLFFTLNLKFVGLVAIILNLIAAILLANALYKTKPKYFYWLLVYPCWLSIATTLNLAIWILN